MFGHFVLSGSKAMSRASTPSASNAVSVTSPFTPGRVVTPHTEV